MNGNSILLDTNIVLYILSGDNILSTSLYNRKLYLSFISQLELLGFKGITSQEQEEIKKFLNDCIIVDINQTIKESVIKLKQAYKIKLPDSIILGTSLYLGIPLMTSDNDFIKIEEANVIYYEGFAK